MLAYNGCRYGTVPSYPIPVQQKKQRNIHFYEILIKNFDTTKRMKTNDLLMLTWISTLAILQKLIFFFSLHIDLFSSFDKHIRWCFLLVCQCYLCNCDPTQVNEADVIRGQIVILLSMCFTGIKIHLDTEIILIPFHSKDTRKIKLLYVTIPRS